jgi:hypothetical protein
MSRKKIDPVHGKGVNMDKENFEQDDARLHSLQKMQWWMFIMNILMTECFRIEFLSIYIMSRIRTHQVSAV